MTREQLIELVAKIAAASGTEAEIEGWIDTVSASVPHPCWDDLLFNYHKELTAEEVVDLALEYRPIVL